MPFPSKPNLRWLAASDTCLHRRRFYRDLLLLISLILGLFVATPATSVYAQGPPDTVWLGGGYIGATPAPGGVANAGNPPAVVYSPDGTRMISNLFVQLWSVTTGQLIRSLDYESYGVSAAVFSPDGQWVLSTGNGLKLWRASDGTLLRVISSNRCVQPLFSPDGHTVAAIFQLDPTNTHGTLQLFDARDGTLLHTIGGASTLSGFTPDGSQIVADQSFYRVSDGMLSLYLLAQGIYSHDFAYLVASYDGELWRVADNARLGYISGQSIQLATFTSDGRLFTEGSDGGQFWYVPDRTPGGYIGTPTGPTIPIPDRAVEEIALSPDTSLVAASTSNGNLVNVWRSSDAALLYSQSDANVSIRSLAFRDNRTLTLSGNDGSLIERDVLTGSRIRSYGNHTGPVYTVSYAPDGQSVFSVDAKGNVRAWRAADGVTLNSFTLPNVVPASTGFQLSPNSQYVAEFSSALSTINIYHTDGSGLQCAIPTVGGQGTFKLLFLPDDQTVLTYTSGGAQWWRLSDGMQLKSLQVLGQGDIQGISPDGQLIATATFGNWGPVNVIRASDGVTLYSVNPPVSLHGATFSPDHSALVLAGGTDREFYLYRLRDGTLVNTLPGFYFQTNVYFAPDSQTFCTGNAGTLRFWRTSDGELLQTYDQETGGGGYDATTGNIDALSYSPDGSHYFYGRDDATVVLANNPFFTALAIARFGVSNITTEGAQIAWTTNIAADGAVDYGTTTAYGNTLSSPTTGTRHSLNLTGLLPNTLYYYRVHSAGAGQTVSHTGSFLTGQVVPSLILSDDKFARNGSDLFVDVTLSNIGAATAQNVQITSAVLSTRTSTGLPIAAPDISAGSSRTLVHALHFHAADFPSGTRTLLTVGGTYTGGTFSATLRVSVP